MESNTYTTVVPPPSTNEFLFGYATQEEDETLTPEEVELQNARDQLLRDRLREKVQAHEAQIAQNFQKQVAKLRKRTFLDDELEQTGFMTERVDLLSNVVQGVDVVARHIPPNMIPLLPPLDNVGVFSQYLLVMGFILAGKLASVASMGLLHFLINCLTLVLPVNTVMIIHCLVIMLSWCCTYINACKFPYAHLFKLEPIHDTVFKKYALFFHVFYLSQLHLILLASIDSLTAHSILPIGISWWILAFFAASFMHISPSDFTLYATVVQAVVVLVNTNFIEIDAQFCILALIPYMSFMMTMRQSGPQISRYSSVAISMIMFCIAGAIGTSQWTSAMFLNSLSTLTVTVTIMSLVITFLVAHWLEEERNVTEFVILLGCLGVFAFGAWTQMSWMLTLLFLAMQFFMLADPVVTMLSTRPEESGHQTQNTEPTTTTTIEEVSEVAQ